MEEPPGPPGTKHRLESLSKAVGLSYQEGIILPDSICLIVRQSCTERLFFYASQALLFLRVCEFLSPFPGDRNSHHIKSPDNAGNMAGVKGTQPGIKERWQSVRWRSNTERHSLGNEPGESWLCSAHLHWYLPAAL